MSLFGHVRTHKYLCCNVDRKSKRFQEKIVVKTPEKST